MASTQGLQRKRLIFYCFFYACLFCLIFIPNLSKSKALDGSILNHPTQALDFDGDFIIGGLFPVFLSEKNATKCQTTNQRFQKFASPRRGVEGCYRMNLFGLMWVEAMLFAIEEINNSTEILPNITLGYDIRDSANDVQFAMNVALDFISGYRALKDKGDQSNRTCSNSSVIAVIGGAGSKISKAAGYILGVVSVPQISYSSTSPSLSNKANFPSFLRTIPPDHIQAQVIADLVTFYRWSYVSTIATDEDYGRLGIEAFKREIKTMNVCISVDELFHPDYTLTDTKAQVARIVRALKADHLAKVVVLFSDLPNALAFLEEAERQNLEGKTWIGTDSWGDKTSVLSFRDSIVGGMLSVVPSKGNIDKFERHMAKLTPKNTRHNPWFQYFWQGAYGCKEEKNENLNETHFTKNISAGKWPEISHQSILSCPGFANGNLPNAASLQLNKAANVMDAVYAVALALDRMVKCKNGAGILPNGTCLEVRNRLQNVELLAYLKNLSFTGKLGFPIVFDKRGDIKGNYLVKSLQRDSKSPGGKKFVTLGTWEWTTRRLQFVSNNISWNGWTSKLPHSHCSLPCEPGYYKVSGSVSCCWQCVPCPIGSITNVSGKSACSFCRPGFTSVRNRTYCLELPEVYLDWGSPAGSVILVFSGIGFFCSIFTLAAFCRHRNSAVVKASTSEYSLLTLILISCTFLLPLLNIGRANNIVCKARPLCFAFIITFLSSLMLTKTLRLLLIFEKKDLSGNVGLYHICTQLFISFLLTLGIIAAVISWIILFPPKVTLHFFETSTCIDCGEKADELLMVILGYTAVLALPTTYLAYRARKLPEHFNETRLIGFTMFTLCVIWIIFVPSYYDSDVQNRSIVFCFALVITGFTALICMFLSRLRIILFQPEKNKTELLRARMFHYTMRMRNGSTAAQYFRETSAVTVGTFSLSSKEL
ncbi:extracellular calcium-sensing receptor-like [Montipora foliosa]|uniref:extracellular calcium-sensing receptor-like n=1 Tax=Montipora foliosa TaxID=591990 RepID=UPI0035F1BCC9